jgi:cation diffusion facilitator CzcD-associated flavoprotein CzcO
MNRICIIGAGATGILLLLLLRDVKGITVVDPNFDGGDLARRWGAIQSNTPWSKTFNALNSEFQSLGLTSTHDLQTITPLSSIAGLLRTASKTYLKNVSQIHGSVLRCDYSTHDRIWTVHVQAGSEIKTTQCEKIILTQGSEPVAYDLAIPSIPLEIAMDVARLKQYVKAGEKVVVFGTKHSGTLAIKSACDLSANVTAIYRSEKPFYYDRDGVYDGIKAEAAAIADCIHAGTIPVTLVHTSNIESLVRATSAADWVVYAMGFRPRQTIQLFVDGLQKSTTAYNDSTGQLEVPNAWGFGIAYPKRAPDGVHFDVSVAAFLQHMKEQAASIYQ